MRDKEKEGPDKVLGGDERPATGAENNGLTRRKALMFLNRIRAESEAMDSKKDNLNWHTVFTNLVEPLTELDDASSDYSADNIRRVLLEGDDKDGLALLDSIVQGKESSLDRVRQRCGESLATMKASFENEALLTTDALSFAQFKTSGHFDRTCKSLFASDEQTSQLYQDVKETIDDKVDAHRESLRQYFYTLLSDESLGDECISLFQLTENNPSVKEQIEAWFDSDEDINTQLNFDGCLNRGRALLAEQQAQAAALQQQDFHQAVQGHANVVIVRGNLTTCNRIAADHKREYGNINMPYVQPLHNQQEGSVTLTFPRGAKPKEQFFAERAAAQHSFIAEDRQHHILAISDGRGSLFKHDGAVYQPNEKMSAGVKLEPGYELPGNIESDQLTTLIPGQPEAGAGPNVA